MNPNDRNTALFGGLVAMFHAAAMQQMGKVQNPVSMKIERDLEQAQMSIDMLEMIQHKTKGNLTADEEKYLSNVLRELKLNYVDESGKKDPPESGETS